MNKLLKLSDKDLELALCPTPITPDAWTFVGKELREAILGKRLLNVSIDLSSACNLNCPYCYTASADSAERDLSSETLSYEYYKKIILQLKDAGTRTVNIIGEGEPTMYPYFDQLVEFIAEQDLKLLVSTNGILLASQEKRIDLLNSINATIILKVNSRKGWLQDILVGRKGYALLRDRVLDKLIKKGFNADTPTRLAVNTLLISSIYTEFNDMFVYCRNNNISLIASIYMPTGRTSGIEFLGQKAIPENMRNVVNNEDLYRPLNQNELDELLRFVIEFDTAHGIRRAPVPAYISGVPCTQLLGVQIDNCGRIWCCPARKMFDNEGVERLQNLAEMPTDLQHLWNNNDFLKGMRECYDGCCIFKRKYQQF